MRLHMQAPWLGWRQMILTDNAQVRRMASQSPPHPTWQFLSHHLLTIIWFLFSTEWRRSPHEDLAFGPWPTLFHSPCFGQLILDSFSQIPFSIYIFLMLFVSMIYVCLWWCCIEQFSCLIHFMSNYLIYETCISPKWLYIFLSWDSTTYLGPGEWG